MSLNVVSFDAKSARKAEVVERIRDLLERAEAGELVDFSYACAKADGSMITGFTATDDAPRRLAAVSMLEFRLHRMMEGQMENELAPGR
ncbi:hypothetical protein J2T08_000555 [Neorhizobium galegae]|uniref:hypothetical protein n=1 Tax=Neorhizobium galegae TaxID=399 RepID=UPI00277D6C66|nr:hypothetical protein [Neorhizobium galegae]MDQ0132654.1 hypothetical protein [Neorhizobium galegae]